MLILRTLALLLMVNNTFAFEVKELLASNQYKIDWTCTISQFEFADYYDNLFKIYPGYKGRVVTVLSENEGEDKIVVVGDLNNPIWHTKEMSLSKKIIENRRDYSYWKYSSVFGGTKRELYFDHKTKQGYFLSRHTDGFRLIGEGNTRAVKIQFVNCQKSF